MFIENKIVEFIDTYFKEKNISVTEELLKDNNLIFEIADLSFRNIILPFLKDFKLNSKGHNHSSLDGKTLNTINERDLKKLISNINVSYFCIMRIIIEKIILNKSLEEGFLNKNKTFFQIENYCFSCGKKYLFVPNFNNKTLEPYYFNEKQSKVIESERCIKENTNGQYSFIHSFPSGKIAFSNDLRMFFTKDDFNKIEEKISEESGFYNTINSDYGQELNAKFNSENGLVYIQVGNTSPTIYYDKINKLITAKSPYIYNSDEEQSTKLTTEIEKGIIITDLWAVCAMDYKLLMKKSKENDVPPNYEFVIKVDPGDYEITSYYSDDEEKIKFFTIKKV